MRQNWIWEYQVVDTSWTRIHSLPWSTSWPQSHVAWLGGQRGRLPHRRVSTTGPNGREARALVFLRQTACFQMHLLKCLEKVSERSFQWKERSSKPPGFHYSLDFFLLQICLGMGLWGWHHKDGGNWGFSTDTAAQRASPYPSPWRRADSLFSVKSQLVCSVNKTPELIRDLEKLEGKGLALK